MHWLEIIRLLASGSKIRGVLANLGEMAAALEPVHGKGAVTVYSRESNEGELMICLSWQGDQAPHKSQGGLALADYLTNHGMVDHEVWIRRALTGETVAANMGNLEVRDD